MATSPANANSQKAILKVGDKRAAQHCLAYCVCNAGVVVIVSCALLYAAARTRDPEHVVPGDARGRDAERELAAEGACVREDRILEVFDYDFSRERVFLEIAAAEMQAKEAKSEAVAASKLSADEDSDDELAKMSANLSLASNGTPHKEMSHQSAVDDDDDDVAAAIRASLREY